MIFFYFLGRNWDFHPATMLGGLAVLRCCAINMQQLSLQGRAGGDNALVWSSTVPSMCVMKGAVAWCLISKS